MNFKNFLKTYSQWILNRAQKYQEFNDETVLESKVSLINYREKMEEIGLGYMHACMHPVCQFLSGGTFNWRRGFYALRN